MYGIFLVMRRIVSCQLYPNNAQRIELDECLDLCRYVFNRCLWERRESWRLHRKGLTRYDQQKHLTQWRQADARLGMVSPQITRDGVRRVEIAFQNYFRRLKEKKGKRGYPRFKSATRYNSFTIQDCRDVVVDGRIRIVGVPGLIRQKGLMEMPGKWKQISVLRRGGRWFAHILVDDGKDAPEARPVDRAVGIDMGLKSFLTTSDGMSVECPNPYRRHERRLSGLCRALDRCEKGSRRRARTLKRLQVEHLRIANIRSDFTHKLSREMVDGYDLIAAEKLTIPNMVLSTLGKRINDAGWGTFLRRIGFKAERAGCQFVLVNSKYTSQECSACGKIVPKTLKERVHSCQCGCTMDRDLNAARVILSRARPSGSGGVRRTEGCKTGASVPAIPLTCVGL